MRLTKGITLLELLIAISLGTLIVLASGAIYLWGWQMFRDAQYIAQAQRKAMVPMMHIVKELQQMAGIFQPAFAIELPQEAPPESIFTLIHFLTYTTPPNFSDGPTEHHIYAWDTDLHQILYDGNIIGNHIANCDFTENQVHGRIIYTIEITATDNNDNNPYTLISNVEARYIVVLPVY